MTLKKMVIGAMMMIMIGNKNMTKLLCLSHLCHGIRRDSGKMFRTFNPTEFFSAMTDSQKNNIVKKLTNTKLMPHEKVKFTVLKKDIKELRNFDLEGKLKKFDLEGKI